VVISHLLGTIKVYSTGRHTLQFTPQSGRGRVQQLGSFDMIHFIPVDEDQIWPRVDVQGNWVGEEYENRNCEVYPYEECAEDTTATSAAPLLRWKK